ncbi:uncharacterized protein CTHT_0011510 [Thermochaetoides thermophila DSM 1495]|uniref:Uncharacterized protein n=1 Tax=Chaetomium thermophilum (strain DSM 1495 / CBS 144.50 / IMI 039719) TaxID=759272 RepID=G0S0W8_CHATD|nr:hypothetical protein CTHT_0011510 [Thermochaetoides thermophila DSM 1495]EGS22678.1 hypothetical protein CTHT_0011510 [Thermochaetoides thermophila DSM 1495]
MKPWAEQRPASPQRAGLATSPSKSPFVRPADIYRRVEEEKERRGPQAGTFPSSTAVSAGTRVDETAHKPSVSENTGLGLQSVHDATLSAERKSEYGLEGLIDSYGHRESTVAHPAGGGDTKLSQEPNSDCAGTVNSRRFSTSPQLPDLARMSGFGEDFFSSALFSGSKIDSPAQTSMQSSVSDCTPAAPSIQPACAGLTSGQSCTLLSAHPPPHTPVSFPSKPVVDSNAPLHSSSASVASNSTTSSSPAGPDQAVGLPFRDKPRELSPGSDGPTEQRQPAAEPSREAALHAGKHTISSPTAPALPGGWVSESATPALEPSHSPQNPALSSHQLPAKAIPSPRSPEAPGLPAGQPQQVALTPNSQEMVIPTSTPATKAATAVSTLPISPREPSPLHIASPVSSQHATSNVDRNVHSPTNQDRLSGSQITTNATSFHLGLTTTAPLNPRKGSSDANISLLPPIVSLPPLDADTSFGSSNSSPVKDSDILSEEIIKSLTPSEPPTRLGGKARELTTAYPAAAELELSRESSYLGDVYGDYWASVGETFSQGDRPKESPQPSPVSLRPLDTLQKPPSAILAKNVVNQTSPEDSTTINPAGAPDTTANGTGTPRNRFSWEEEDVGESIINSSGQRAQTPSEPKASVSDVAQSSVLATEPTTATTAVTKPSPISSKVDIRQPSPDPQFVCPPERSQAAAGGASDKAPGFSVSDYSVSSRSPVLERPDVQISTRPLSPSENAVSQDSSTGKSPEAEQAKTSNVSSIKKDSPNTMPFRKIMELSSPAERIKQYNHARWQVSTADSGLTEWVSVMLARHPEHVDSGFSTTPALRSPGFPGQGQGPLKSPIVLSGASHHLHQLGHSSNQMGSKGKEFLMAAGKAGKGLLNKGRSKLKALEDKLEERR